jgi:hypothetical protein
MRFRTCCWRVRAWTRSTGTGNLRPSTCASITAGRSTVHAVELGICSQIAIQLFDEPDSVGSLNLYSSRPQAFDDDTIHAAHMFAIYAAHALGRVITKTRYHDALLAHATIGQATGIVMQQYTLNQAQAFEFLARVAQNTGLTLEALAAQFVQNANSAATIDPDRVGPAEQRIARLSSGGRAEPPDP